MSLKLITVKLNGSEVKPFQVEVFSIYRLKINSWGVQQEQ